MIGNTHFDQLVANAPVNSDSPKVDWSGIRELLQTQGIEPTSVVAVSWCSFGTHNIEALVDAPALAIVHPRGVLSSVGKRKTLGKSLKFDAIDFGTVRGMGEAEHTDDRGLGKFCIEFAGAGSVLLGRLQWSWRAKRFRDSREQVMAVATERDRIYNVIQGLIA